MRKNRSFSERCTLGKIEQAYRLLVTLSRQYSWNGEICNKGQHVNERSKQHTNISWEMLKEQEGHQYLGCRKTVVSQNNCFKMVPSEQFPVFGTIVLHCLFFSTAQLTSHTSSHVDLQEEEKEKNSF